MESSDTIMMDAIVPVEALCEDDGSIETESEQGSIDWDIEEIDPEIRSLSGSDVTHPVSLRSQYSPAVTPLVVSDVDDDEMNIM
eukprot:6459526-Amphidinium_carterae.1